MIAFFRVQPACLPVGAGCTSYRLFQPPGDPFALPHFLQIVAPGLQHFAEPFTCPPLGYSFPEAL